MTQKIRHDDLSKKLEHQVTEQLSTIHSLKDTFLEKDDLVDKLNKKIIVDSKS